MELVSQREGIVIAGNVVARSEDAGTDGDKVGANFDVPSLAPSRPVPVAVYDNTP